MERGKHRKDHLHSRWQVIVKVMVKVIVMVIVMVIVVIFGGKVTNNLRSLFFLPMEKCMHGQI